PAGPFRIPKQPGGGSGPS
nr:2S albumin small chain 1 nIV - rape (fragments) [Brassica napus]